jgi:hypothetical protein
MLSLLNELSENTKQHMSKFCEWRVKNKKIILMQIGFSDKTKMQHEFLSESAVLRMNKSPLKKVQQSGVVSK